MKNKKEKKKKGAIQEFLDRRIKEKDFSLRKNRIAIFYGEPLDKITGIKIEETLIPDGFTFADFLHGLFISYPEIPKQFSPGQLGFIVNNRTPQTFDILKDKDKIALLVASKPLKPDKHQIEMVRKKTENRIEELIKEYGVEITIQEIKKVIYNEKDSKDFDIVLESFYEKTKDIDEINKILNVFTTAWNYFPHKSLNGLCPMEKLDDFQKTNPYINKKSNPEENKIPYGARN